MLTDYQDRNAARRRLLVALIPAAVTAVLGALLIGALTITAARAQDASPYATVQDSAAVAPDFELTDTAGQTHKLSDYLADGHTVVLEWFNPGCPYVRKYHDGEQANPSLREAHAFASDQGVVWLAVNSNAPGKQGSGLEANREARRNFGMAYPVLLDESGTVGQAYGATSTPQLFVISPAGEIRYSGGADDTVTAQDQASVNYIMTALRQQLAGEPVEPAVTPHPGCSVKYAN